MDSVRALREHRDWEAEHKDVEAPEINAKDWPRTMDAIEDWRPGCLGVTKRPLAYVVRDDMNVPNQDPDDGDRSCLDELVARAPIQDANGNPVATYVADRTLV